MPRLMKDLIAENQPTPLTAYNVIQTYASYRAALNAALDSMGADSAFQADDVADDESLSYVPESLRDEWIYTIRIEMGGWDVCYVHAFEPEHHYTDKVDTPYYTITPKL